MRPRARARDHDVVGAEVDRLHRVRVERQQAAEGLGRGAQPLEERRVDVPVREPALRPLLVVDGREDVRLRVEVAQRGEDALGAPHVDEEVVDERDTSLHGGASLWHAHQPLRSLLPLLVTLVTLLLAAPASGAAPREFFGVMLDGPGLSRRRRPPGRDEAHGRLGRRERARRLLLARDAAARGRARRLQPLRPRRRRRGARRAARLPDAGARAVVGGGRGRPRGRRPLRSLHLRVVRGRRRPPLRPRRHLLGGEPDAPAALRLLLPGVERAGHRALLARRSLAGRLRHAAARGAPGDQGASTRRPRSSPRG